MVGNHCPNPKPENSPRVVTARALTDAVVKAVEGGDLRPAVAGSKALAAYVEGLVGDGDHEDSGNDRLVHPPASRSHPARAAAGRQSAASTYHRRGMVSWFHARTRCGGER